MTSKEELDNSALFKSLFKSDDYKEEFGTIHLVEQPEGLVLWVGGEIKWRSFKDRDFELESLIKEIEINASS